MVKNYKYKTFEDWLEEPEGYGTRAERFYFIIDTFSNKGNLDSDMRAWMEAAFNAGREKRRGCRFPACHCVTDKCEYIHKIVRNPI